MGTGCYQNSLWDGPSALFRGPSLPLCCLSQGCSWPGYKHHICPGPKIANRMDESLRNSPRWALQENCPESYKIERGWEWSCHPQSFCCPGDCSRRSLVYPDIPQAKIKWNFQITLPSLTANDFVEVLGLHNREEMWENQNLNLFQLLFSAYKLYLGCSSKVSREKEATVASIILFLNIQWLNRARLGQPVSGAKILWDLVYSRSLHLSVYVQGKSHKTGLAY